MEGLVFQSRPPELFAPIIAPWRGHSPSPSKFHGWTSINLMVERFLAPFLARMNYSCVAVSGA